VDAFVYWELDAAYAAQTGTRAAVPRLSRNFHWPRIRGRLEDPSIPEDVRLDPWKVDWKAAAAKIVLSGFDKRRFVSETRKEIPIPVPAGPWVGTSPFVPPIFFGEGEMPVFPAGSKPESWFSPAGILRCTAETWMLIPWPEDG
jgi:hypothetical protein